MKDPFENKETALYIGIEGEHIESNVKGDTPGDILFSLAALVWTISDSLKMPAPYIVEMLPDIISEISEMKMEHTTIDLEAVSRAKDAMEGKA